VTKVTKYGFTLLKPPAITNFFRERAKWRENIIDVTHANEFHFEEYSVGNKCNLRRDGKDKFYVGHKLRGHNNLSRAYKT